MLTAPKLSGLITCGRLRQLKGEFCWVWSPSRFWRCGELSLVWPGDSETWDWGLQCQHVCILPGCHSTEWAGAWASPCILYNLPLTYNRIQVNSILVCMSASYFPFIFYLSLVVKVMTQNLGYISMVVTNVTDWPRPLLGEIKCWCHFRELNLNLIILKSCGLAFACQTIETDSHILLIIIYFSLLAHLSPWKNSTAC